MILYGDLTQITR